MESLMKMAQIMSQVHSMMKNAMTEMITIVIDVTVSVDRQIHVEMERSTMESSVMREVFVVQAEMIVRSILKYVHDDLQNVWLLREIDVPILVRL